MGAIFREFEPDLQEQDQGTVARLTRRWEDTLARKTRAAGALSLTAVSLAACGDDDEGGDGGAEAAAFNFDALEDVAGDAAGIFIPWFGGEDNEGDANDGGGNDAPVDGGGGAAPVGGGDGPVLGGGLDDDGEPDDDGDFPGFGIILSQLFSGFGGPAEGALTADLLSPAGPIFEADLGLLNDDLDPDGDIFEELIETLGRQAISDDHEGPDDFGLPEILADALDEMLDQGLLSPDDMPPLGFKVWHYNPETGQRVDLTDGIGDPGPGLGDPSNRYPWSFEMFKTEEDGQALFVGAMNSNPFPINFFYNIAGFVGSGFTEQPGLPTTYTTGPEIWRWMPDEIPAPINDGPEALAVPSPDGGTWQQVLAADDLPGLDSQMGIRELHAHDGYLYASTSNNLVPFLFQSSKDQASLIRTMNGTDWEFVPTDPGFGDDPFDNPGLSSIRSMESHHDKLFVGTEVADSLLALLAPGPLPPVPDFLKHGLWYYEEGNTWTQVTDGDPIEGLAVSEILSFVPTEEDHGGTETADFEVSFSDHYEDALLFFGNWNPEGSNLYMVEETGGTSGDVYTITDVTPTHVAFLDLYGGGVPSYVTGAPDFDGKYEADDFNGTSPFDDFGVIKLFEFDGYMYLSGVDYFDGATLMRTMDPTDPTCWELLTADGFFSELGLASGTSPIGPVPALQGNFYFWSATVVGEGESAIPDPDAPPALEAAPIEEPTLFLGTFNGAAGTGQVFRITHADDEFDTPEIVNVTGEATGAPEGIYGIRSAESSVDDTVFLGGASSGIMPDLFSDPYPAAIDV